MLKCVEDSNLPYSQRHDFKPVFEYEGLDVGQSRWFPIKALQGSIHCATCGLVYADTRHGCQLGGYMLISEEQINEAQWRLAQDVTDDAKAD
jgi:hypothetical protein